MKLTFLGAAREVTGSCTLIEAGGHRFLVDCGMEQGKDVYPNADLPCAPGEIEAILLTHAHIDHSGRIPYLYKNGFRGPIYSTDATMDLCEIMLEDSAHIQEQEAEWKNRKAQRSGNELVEPDYTVEDAMAVMKQFVPQSYGKPLRSVPRHYGHLYRCRPPAGQRFHHPAGNGERRKPDHCVLRRYRQPGPAADP